jgi:hypothetical protein
MRCMCVHQIQFATHIFQQTALVNTTCKFRFYNKRTINSPTLLPAEDRVYGEVPSLKIYEICSTET